eukprot:SAG25_NODE_11625_length_300_cov_0.278607_1_plen_33_part_01
MFIGTATTEMDPRVNTVCRHDALRGGPAHVCGC